MDPNRLPTEQSRDDLSDLDLRSTLELVQLMAGDQLEAQEAVARVAPDISAAIETIVARMRQGGRLIYVGAGTPGRLGLLDAAECPATFNSDQVIGIMAGGAAAFTASRGEVEDDRTAGARDIDGIGVAEDDVVVGITASGRTPYTIGAIMRARELGAATVGISCNPAALLSEHVDHRIEVVVGPEFIAGSTRLKAGSAQKAILNMLSTISMVRLGKTFGNLMVDVQATNTKLQERARRIVCEATGAREHVAAEALDAAEGDVKVAILTLLTGSDVSQARRNLTAHHGMLRQALEAE
ncbi:MAG TPA: N-acetylmuramic acid 6-phosphate etherase [Acidimicrobiia bacterium]|nr:N-acetylmuramic acid 6-phosphate etherase [Acidimicrobiia bacterium]